MERSELNGGSTAKKMSMLPEGGIPEGAVADAQAVNKCPAAQALPL